MLRNIIQSKNDMFFFDKFKLEKISQMPVNTKRYLLSTLPRIFDPCHLLSPLILAGRLLFSQCCNPKQPLAWDEQLPSPLREEVVKWQKTIPLCSALKIARWIPLPENKTNCYIITAGDGAEFAFGARAFILVPRDELPGGAPLGNIYLNDKLVQRKVADSFTHIPFYILSKRNVVSRSYSNWNTQTLELKGAHLAAELTTYLPTLYDIPI